MSEAVLRLNAMSAALPALIVAVFVESALLATAVAGLGRFFRSPSVRYWLWQAVALKLLLLPFWTVTLALPAAKPESKAPAEPIAGTGSTASAESLPVSPPLGESLPPASVVATKEPPALPWWRELRWPSWLLLAWLLGVAWQIGVLAWQRGRLNRLLRTSRRCDEPAILARLREVSAALDLSSPAVILSGEVTSPFVCGLLRPTLILPANIAATLSESQLRQVLLHELAHLRRHDLWWGWLPELARLIWFFNPVAWWVTARVRLERELACDRLVLAHAGAPAADYADTLVRVAGHGSIVQETLT